MRVVTTGDDITEQAVAEAVLPNPPSARRRRATVDEDSDAFAPLDSALVDPDADPATVRNRLTVANSSQQRLTAANSG